MNRVNWMIAVVVSGAALLAACAPVGTTRSYPAGSIGTAMRVSQGEILAIETVTVDGRHSAIGTWSGAVIGNSVGRTAGEGSGRRIAGAVGAVGGAVAGRAIERAATSRKAVEVIVQLDSGQVIAIVQESDETLREGDRVRVLRGGRFDRVVPI